jgi:subtilisin family serine protease
LPLRKKGEVRMKNRLLLLSFVLVAIMATSIMPMSSAESTMPFSEPTLLDNPDISFGVEPAKEHCLSDWDWCELPEGTVPFNVDMVDAEKVCYDGEGIYVAVLDTGILTDWMNFFPPDTVEIDWSLAKGFTHDYYFDTAVGDFVMGPLRDDRGPFTHDLLNPTPVIGPDNVFYGYFNGTWLQYPAVGPSGWGSGHGTHVQSIITGWKLERDQEFWVRGVAPKVTIIPVLVLDDWLIIDDQWNLYFDHGGTWEMVAAGIKYIGDLADELGIKIIINMSLGGGSPFPLIEDAIDYAINKGVIVIVSAGNEGYTGMDWPGAYPQAISVAAAGWTQEYLRYYTGEPDPWYWWTDDVPERLWTEDPLGNEFQVYLTDFSSRPNPELGQEIYHLDVSAPGAAVRGPYKGYGPTLSVYACVWGTSQAAPHISGIAALILEKRPWIEQCRMEIILKGAGLFNRLTKRFEKERSATVFDIFSFDLLEQTWLREDYGTGLVQADAALFMARIFCRSRSGSHGHWAYIK